MMHLTRLKEKEQKKIFGKQVLLALITCSLMGIHGSVSAATTVDKLDNTNWNGTALVVQGSTGEYYNYASVYAHSGFGDPAGNMTIHASESIKINNSGSEHAIATDNSGSVLVEAPTITINDNRSTFTIYTKTGEIKLKGALKLDNGTANGWAIFNANGIVKVNADTESASSSTITQGIISSGQGALVHIKNATFQANANSNKVVIESLDSSKVVLEECDLSRVNMLNAGPNGEIDVLNSDFTVVKNTVDTFYPSNVNIIGSEGNIVGKINFSFGNGNTLNIGEVPLNATNLTLKSGATLNIQDVTKFADTAAIQLQGAFLAEENSKAVIGNPVAGTYKIVATEGGVTNAMSINGEAFTSGLVDGAWIADANNLSLRVTAHQGDTPSEIEIVENFDQITNDDFKTLVTNINNGSTTYAAAHDALTTALQAPEVGGSTATALNIINNVSGVTTGHLSMSVPAPTGGRGVGLLDKGSEAAVWAQYVHGKDKADGLAITGGSTNYNNSYNGIVVGLDFKKVDKFQSGIAFNYVDGDGTSWTSAGVRGNTDFNAYGLTYYGAVRNDDINTIFDIGYTKAEADSKQIAFGIPITSNNNVKTWSAGVMLEKAYTNTNNGTQYIPYVSARYLNVDNDKVRTSVGTELNYDQQNIGLFTAGLRFQQRKTTSNGWMIVPKADLAYVWAAGDTDSKIDVAISGLTETSTVGCNVMDDSSFLGVIGVEATKGNWTYGLSYSYQKGDAQQSQKYYVDVKYKF